MAPHYETLFPSTYIKATDLTSMGHNVTIVRVAQEVIQGFDGEPDKDTPVVYFQGSDKGLTMNKTRCIALATFAGNQYEQWPGTQINIYQGETLYKGKLVPCVVLRAPASGQAQAQGGQPASAPAPEQAPVETTAAWPKEDENPAGAPDGDLPF